MMMLLRGGGGGGGGGDRRGIIYADWHYDSFDEYMSNV